MYKDLTKSKMKQNKKSASGFLIQHVDVLPKVHGYWAITMARIQFTMYLISSVAREAFLHQKHFSANVLEMAIFCKTFANLSILKSAHMPVFTLFSNKHCSCN